MIQSILEEELKKLKEKALYRTLRTLEPLGGARARYEGKEVLLFCGNDYLGLSEHPRVLAAIRKAALRQGAGSGASRLISGTTTIHQEVEEKIARLKGKEKALLYSSGYMTNVGVITSLAGAKDLIVMDKLCHASIVDGARLSGATIRTFPHKNYRRCQEIVKKAKGFGQKFLISESVFSMDGDLADVEELVKIKTKYSCFLLIDDAHGTGTLGPTGKGALEGSPFLAEVDVLMGTLSKAVGCLGGFAASSKLVIEYLINTSRPFIFATSLPPILCAALSEALSVIEESTELNKSLWENARQAHQGLSQGGFDLLPLSSPILPVMIGDEKEALDFSKQLLAQGIFVPAIRTPTVPKGKARLRVTLSASHSKEDIRLMLEAFRRNKKMCDNSESRLEPSRI